MTDPSSPNRFADLAAYSAVLRSRIEGTEATRPEVTRIVDDLAQRLGRDAVVTLVGSLALKASGRSSGGPNSAGPAPPPSWTSRSRTSWSCSTRTAVSADRAAVAEHPATAEVVSA